MSFVNANDNSILYIKREREKLRGRKERDKERRDK
jgi:hypothetical protein